MAAARQHDNLAAGCFFWVGHIRIVKVTFTAFVVMRLNDIYCDHICALVSLSLLVKA